MKKLVVNSALILSTLFSVAIPIKAADLVDTAATSGSLKVFVAALKAAGFAETLSSSGPYTVFAPSDEAFSRLPPGTWETLSKDKIKLAGVLAYHVVPGKMLITEIKPGNVKTVEGDALTLTSDNGKVTVNNANVIESDLTADNGVIHAIDMVLMPADGSKPSSP